MNKKRSLSGGFFQSIEAVDAMLSAWVKSVVDTESVTFGPPKAVSSGSAVNVYLVGLGAAPSRDTHPEAPMQLLLHYVLTAWAETAESEHAMLSKLAFAALQRTDFQVAFDSPPDSLWIAAGIPPRPCFMITLPVMKFREAVPVHLVQEPLIARSAFIKEISGGVADGRGQPVSDARITLSPLSESAVTASDGSFTFKAMPADMTPERIGDAFEVIVNGKQRKAGVVQDPREDGILSFTITLSEE